MKKGNTVSSRKTAGLSFLVVGLMGLWLFSGEAFAYPECNAPDIELGDYTIAACNIGTTIAGTGEESYGAYFQWGNNYGFTTGIVVAPMNDRIDASAFGPENHYYSGVFHPVDGSPYDWDVSMNPNKWGGSGDEATKNGVGTDLDRQGPCASGYHIPSTLEWYELSCLWLGLQGESCPSAGNFVGDDNLIYSFSNTFLLPFAGDYHYRTVTLTNSGRAGYYVSSSAGPSDSTFFQGFELSYGLRPQQSVGRTYGMSLRCFKNDIRNEVCNRVTDISKAECKALVDLYYSTNGDNWTKGFSGDIPTNKPRLTGSQACNWYGIACDTAIPKHIIETTLNSNNLSGELPLTLANLTKMQTFALIDNKIQGTLPDELSARNEIQSFRMERNHLQGSLPKAWSTWTTINRFYISQNQITGTLPKERSTWENMQYFSVRDNHIGGVLPPEWSTRTKIIYFYVYNNDIIGILPVSYANWTGIVDFYTHSNRMSGSLPKEYGVREKIEDVRIQNNTYEGLFPLERGIWDTLRKLYIGNNKITGGLPETRTFLSSIVTGEVSVDNNCLDTNLTNPLSSWMDEKSQNGSGRRLTQTACQVIVPATPAPSYGGGGGGGVALTKDSCPDGDFSPSYYDGMCTPFPKGGSEGNEQGDFVDGELENETSPTPSLDGLGTGSYEGEQYEIQSAYDWAFAQGITTLSPIENADPNGPLLRSHMAKMVVNYLLITPLPSLRSSLSPAVLREDKIRNLSTMQANNNEDENNEFPLFLSRSTAGVAEGGGATEYTTCTFSDISNITEELQQYIIQACELGLMGIHSDGTPLSDFMPNKKVSRAEFGTVLSRILWGETYNNATPYYANHLQALKNNGIMTQIDNPEKRLELRKWVWVMLMRGK